MSGLSPFSQRVSHHIAQGLHDRFIAAQFRRGRDTVDIARMIPGATEANIHNRLSAIRSAGLIAKPRSHVGAAR